MSTGIKIPTLWQSGVDLDLSCPGTGRLAQSNFPARVLRMWKRGGKAARFLVVGGLLGCSTAAQVEAPVTDGQNTSKLACPDAVTTGILACVAEQQADPEFDDTNFFLVDQLLACADAEPVASTLDGYCSKRSADPAVCGLDLEDFVADVLPACMEKASETLFQDACVFGATVNDLRFSPWLVELSRSVLDDVSAVAAGSVLEQQLIASVGATQQQVSSAAEALAVTDDDAFDVLTLLDVGSRRTIVVITAHYGDNRYGRAFFADTAFAVADIIDGDISACLVERRTEGTPCSDDAVCGPGGSCMGLVKGEICVDGACEASDVVLGEGRCVGTFAEDSQPASGETCASDAECPASEGLVCMVFGSSDSAESDSAESASGQCGDAWLSRRFAVEEATIAAGATTTIPFVVSGVATVSLNTRVSMVISHPNPSDLKVSIQHPNEGSVAVLYQDPNAVGPEIILNDVRAQLPSDESINGTWNLIIEDAGASGVDGSAFHIEVAADSWWD